MQIKKQSTIELPVDRLRKSVCDDPKERGSEMADYSDIGRRTVPVCELFGERGKAGTLRVLGLGLGKRTVPVCELFGERGQSGDASRTWPRPW